MKAAAVKPWGGRRSTAASVLALRIGSVALGLAYVKTYTLLLSTGEVGAFFYLAALSYVLNALVFVPADFYLQARVSQLSELPWNGIARLAIQVLAVALVACVVLSIPLLVLDKLAVWDLPALYLAAALLYLCVTARGMLNNRDSVALVAFFVFFEAGARLAVFVALSQWIDPSARLLLYSTVAALALELCLIVWQSRARLLFSNEHGVLDSTARVCSATTPVSMSAILNLAQLQSYRVLYPIQGLATTSGIYAVVSNVGAAAMSAIGSVFSQLEMPKIYNSAGESIGTYVKKGLALTAIVLVSTLLLDQMLVRVLTKPEYAPYAHAMSFGVITEGANLIINGMTVFLMLKSQSMRLLAANALAAVIAVGGVGLALHLRPMDPFAIGIPIVCSQLLMTALLLMKLRRRPTKRIEDGLV